MKSIIGFCQLAQSKQRKRLRGRSNTKKNLHCPFVSKSFCFQTLMKLILKLANYKLLTNNRTTPEFCEGLSRNQSPLHLPCSLVESIKGGTPRKPRKKAMISNESIVTGSLVEDDSSASEKIGHENAKVSHSWFLGKIHEDTIHLKIALIYLDIVWQLPSPTTGLAR